MWAGIPAGRARELIDTVIALGRLENRCAALVVKKRFSGAIRNFYHNDVFIRAAIGAGGAADTGIVVNDHRQIIPGALNRTGRATDQADRIVAMHAGMGDHHSPMSGPGPDKAGITIMGSGARAHAIIAPCTAKQIDHHPPGAVDKSTFHQKLHKTAWGVVFLL